MEETIEERERVAGSTFGKWDERVAGSTFGKWDEMERNQEPNKALALAKSAAAAAILLLDKAFSYHPNSSMEGFKGLLQHNLCVVQRASLDDLPPGRWPNEFRCAVEEFEDAIDEIEYENLSRMSEEEVRNPILKLVKAKIVHAVARPVNLKRLRKAISELAAISELILHRAIRFLPIIGGPIGVDLADAHQPYRRKTTSLLTTEVFGREMEKEKIVRWLIEKPEVVSRCPVAIFSVVGMAGMGKTTLAQLVYADHQVQRNFDLLVWVSMSVDFGAETIMTEILRVIDHQEQRIIDDAARSRAIAILRTRRTLLILDDVWEDENMEKWEDLLSPLRFAMRGSKILLTTRMQSVADMAADVVGFEAECLELDELNSDNNYLVFKDRLFHSTGFEDDDNLMLIGEQMVKRVGGCPILAVAIASRLSGTSASDRQTFRRYMDDIIESIILEAFGLSYHCLATQLQVCFSYCAIFSRGHKFNKDELVDMWVCSGLIPLASWKPGDIGLPRKENASLLKPEDVGQQCFALLRRKSFFRRMLERDPANGDQKEYYVLHNLMHDLAQLVSRGECARVDNDDFSFSVGRISSSYDMQTTRHLSIAHSSNITEHIIRDISYSERLRTLIIQSEICLDRQTEVLLGQVLGSLKCLRLLYLDVPSLSHVLVRVSSLTHLRYLFLFSCDGSHLHRTFKLYHLQVFKVIYLTAKEADFNGICNLRCLRCLHMPDNMSSKIRQLGRLTSLQELHGFEDDHRLNALNNLTSLRRLSLRNLQNVRCEEAMQVKLNSKQHMKFLSLSWNKYWKGPESICYNIINSLGPNKEIQQLHIHGYNGTLLPLWMEESLPIHLVSLELEYCMKWKTVPSLQELNSLKYLKLDHLFQLECIGTVLSEQFETKESENASLPPFLNTLIVQGCHNLKKLPAIPCTLEQLMMKHVGLTVLPRMRHTCTSRWESAHSFKCDLAFVHIESCAQLTSLDEGLLKQQKHLQSLTTLVVRHCERLRHLPANGFTELHHLNILEVVACPMLRDAKTEGSLLPMSLGNLDINPCGDVEVSVLMSLQNLTFLRRFTLFNCSNVKKLPSEEVFGTLYSLNDVSIARCKNLLTLGGLGAVASLRDLSILSCDKLHFSDSQQAGCSFKLQKLEIDRQALFLVEPVKSLGHTRELHICDDYAMESLPKEWLLQNAASLHSIEIGVAESLRSLPSEMVNLEALQSLHIERAPLIESLPQMPVSLTKLTMGCNPMFLKRYEKDVGPDWGRIAHIADVDMKACSEGSYVPTSAVLHADEHKFYSSSVLAYYSKMIMISAKIFLSSFSSKVPYLSGIGYNDDQIQDFDNSTNNPCRQFAVID